MRSQTRRFLRSVWAEIRDTIPELLRALAATIGMLCVLAVGFGVLCLLGWGAAALWRWGPTTSEDRGLGTVAVLFAGVLGLFAYACVRDLRRWLRRHWQAAQREAERT